MLRLLAQIIDLVGLRAVPPKAWVMKMPARTLTARKTTTSKHTVTKAGEYRPLAVWTKLIRL